MKPDITEEVLEFADEKYELAQKYNEEVNKYAKAKAELFTMLTANISRVTAQKKNAGIDMALTLLVSMFPEFRDVYSDYIIGEDRVKGLSKLIDALETKIISRQSVMRYQRENDS